ncbi:cilia- and flagella-associated protein 68 isoform 2-T2 [Mantella aurantiaca]
MAYYSSDVKADGHGEVWMDFSPDAKLRQYGWRCTTKEDSYSNKTLLGNWNQERYDLSKLEERKPLPSQFSRESPMCFQHINLNWVHLNTEPFKSQVTQWTMAPHSLIIEYI